MDGTRTALQLGFVLTKASVFHSFGRRLGMISAALALTLAVPSRGAAQTLSLGQAGQFGLFAMPGPPSTGNIFASNLTVDGSVALGANTRFGGGPATILGTVYEDTGARYTATGTVTGGIVSASLSQASQDAKNASSAAAGWNSSNANDLTSSFGNLSTTSTNTGNYVITGSTNNSGQNVVNFGYDPNFLNSTITINATSPTEQFVFNFSGGLSLTNTNIILNGVSPQNVFFNITGGWGIGIAGSTLSGAILDTSGVAMSLDAGDIIDGSVISNNFVDISGAVIAPELPTLAMAGVASLLVLGGIGFNRLRSRRAESAVPSQA